MTRCEAFYHSLQLHLIQRAKGGWVREGDSMRVPGMAVKQKKQFGESN